MNSITPKNNLAGCPEAPENPKNFVFGEAVSPIILPTWEEQSGLEKFYRYLIGDLQWASDSCTGQGISKYLELLFLYYLDMKLDFSAKDIFSQIALDYGAYISAGFEVVNNVGCSEERYLSSYLPDDYMVGENLTVRWKAWMRDRTMVTQKGIKNATQYMFRHYLTTPRASLDKETLRQMIAQGKGLVSGFRGHCVVFVDWCVRAGEQNFIYFNSYKPNIRYLPTKRIGELYNVWTAMPELSSEYLKTKGRMTKELLETLCLAVFHRKPDEEMQKYVGHSIGFVLIEWMKSKEWKNRGNWIKILRFFRLIS